MWRFHCSFHKESNSSDFCDCSATNLPCPHSGIMTYEEHEGDLNELCFFAIEVIRRRERSE